MKLLLRFTQLAFVRSRHFPSNMAGLKFVQKCQEETGYGQVDLYDTKHLKIKIKSKTTKSLF